MGRDHLNLVAGCWRVNDSIMLCCQITVQRSEFGDIRSDVTELLGLTSDTVLRRTVGAESSFPSDLNRGGSWV